MCAPEIYTRCEMRIQIGKNAVKEPTSSAGGAQMKTRHHTSHPCGLPNRDLYGSYVCTVYRTQTAD